MAIDIERELRLRQPGTARLGIAPDGSRVVHGAEDIIAVDIDTVNRLLAAEHSMLSRRGQLLDDALPPAPLEESADGQLVLDDEHVYRLVRRDRRHPNVAIYERAS